jgi:hypothetical protein
MCKEMPVIQVNRVVDKKRKMEGQGGGDAQGVEGMINKSDFFGHLLM